MRWRALKEDRDNPHLVRELVRCGKSSCGCAKDVRRRTDRTGISDSRSVIDEPGRPTLDASTFPRVSWRACAPG